MLDLPTLLIMLCERYHGPWVPFENKRGYFPLSGSGQGTNKDFSWLNCDPAGHGGHDISTKPDYPVCMNQTYALLDAWYATLRLRLNVSTLVRIYTQRHHHLEKC